MSTQGSVKSTEGGVCFRASASWSAVVYVAQLESTFEHAFQIYIDMCCSRHSCQPTFSQIPFLGVVKGGLLFSCDAIVMV